MKEPALSRAQGRGSLRFVQKGLSVNLFCDPSGVKFAAKDPALDRYERHRPSIQLRPWVDSIYIQETEAEKTYTVMPEPGLVLGFQYSGRISLVDKDKGDIRLQPQGITGLHGQARIFHSSEDLGSIIVKFRPLGARSFLRIPASDLRQQSVALRQVSNGNGLNRVEDTLSEARDDGARIEAVETYLLTNLMPQDDDPLLDRALRLIHQRRGWIRIADLSECLGTSASPLERRFNDLIGTSPKGYASIVRLHRIMDLLLQDPSDLSDLALGMGFHDQAHFINEFKRMTGMTPGRFIESGPAIDEFLQFDE